MLASSSDNAVSINDASGDSISGQCSTDSSVECSKQPSITESVELLQPHPQSLKK